MIAALGAVLMAAAAVIAVLIAVTGTGIAAAIVWGFTAMFAVMAGVALAGIALTGREGRRAEREREQVGDDAIALVKPPAPRPSAIDIEISQMIENYGKGGK